MFRADQESDLAQPARFLCRAVSVDLSDLCDAAGCSALQLDVDERY